MEPAGLALPTRFAGPQARAFGGCSATLKIMRVNRDWSCTCAGCDKAPSGATKRPRAHVDVLTSKEPLLHGRRGEVSRVCWRCGTRCMLILLLAACCCCCCCCSWLRQTLKRRQTAPFSGYSLAASRQRGTGLQDAAMQDATPGRRVHSQWLFDRRRSLPFPHLLISERSDDPHISDSDHYPGSPYTSILAQYQPGPRLVAPTPAKLPSLANRRRRHRRPASPSARVLLLWLWVLPPIHAICHPQRLARLGRVCT